MGTQLQHRQDDPLWRVVDEQHPRQVAQQQIIYVTVDGPTWLQMILSAPPSTLMTLAVVAGIGGGVVVVSLVALAAIVAQFAATVAIALVAGIVGIVALGVLVRI